MANKKQDCIVALDPVIRDEIRSGLLGFGKVKVVGLGIFETKDIPARAGRNPQTGEIVMIPNYKKIKFRPTAALKEIICKQ